MYNVHPIGYNIYRQLILKISSTDKNNINL